MSAIIEQVLQLPREEKLALLHALQEDLEHEHRGKTIYQKINGLKYSGAKKCWKVEK